MQGPFFPHRTSIPLKIYKIKLHWLESRDEPISVHSRTSPLGSTKELDVLMLEYTLKSHPGGGLKAEKEKQLFKGLKEK